MGTTDRSACGGKARKETLSGRRTEGNPVWKTNFGFLARDFLWINWPDNDDLVTEVIREICVDWRIREELYEEIE